MEVEVVQTCWDARAAFPGGDIFQVATAEESVGCDISAQSWLVCRDEEGFDELLVIYS